MTGKGGCQDSKAGPADHSDDGGLELARVDALKAPGFHLVWSLILRESFVQNSSSVDLGA
jgi:hypothetical protein